MRLWLVLLLLPWSECAKILMVTMCGTRSHTVPFVSLSKALSDRGHNVTFLTGFPGVGEDANAEEIAPNNMVRYIYDFHKNVDFIGHRFHGTHAIPPPELFRYGIEMCNTLLQDIEFLRFINEDRKFDLIVIDSTYSACAVGLAHRYRAPYIFLNAVAFFTAPLSIAGNIIPYSTFPYMFSGYTEDMNLVQRAWNAFCYIVEWAGNYALADWYLQPILERTFGEDMPSIVEMQRNVSFILHNGHPLLTYSRALLPNVAEIGCIHCRPPNPLPKELEEFVSGAGSRGVVLVSMGSITCESSMPADVRRIFAEALSQLKHRVIWKWSANDSTIFPDPLPSNIRVVDWMPQQDLLGHPGVVAMVSHGGLLSMFETAYHGKPSVMMPIFFDHDTNTAKAEKDGYALRLDLKGLTSKALETAINKVIQDSSYRINAERKALLLRDQPMTALETSVFWAEHVIRHRGAAHLQAKQVSMVSFAYVDVIITLVAVIYVGTKFNAIIEKLTEITEKFYR